MHSGCEESRKITSVLNKHFHKPSPKCPNADIAKQEIKVIYFLANSLLLVPLLLISTQLLFSFLTCFASTSEPQSEGFWLPSNLSQPVALNRPSDNEKKT